jgi:hypothetical protein
VLRALSYIKIKVEDKLIVDDCGLPPAPSDEQPEQSANR